MNQTYLETREDLAWLQEVHQVYTVGYVGAILYGSEDCPTKVEVFARNHYKCKPAVYERIDTGQLVLTKHGEKPKFK